MELNVLGTHLAPCSYDPLTGFHRDGCCSADPLDVARHLVCVKVTAEFLNFSMHRGNDLSTPRPQFRFRGLVPGDRWCLCALRWREAYEAGVAPAVVLECTHERTLDFVPLAWLQERGLDPVG